MTTVHVGEDAVSYREQSGFGRVVRAKTVLGEGEEMVLAHITRELSLHQALDNLGYSEPTLAIVIFL